MYGYYNYLDQVKKALAFFLFSTSCIKNYAANGKRKRLS